MKIAVVTGAGSGIGRAVALGLRGEGWAVVIAGRRAEELRTTASIACGGPEMLVVPTDVGQAGGGAGFVRARRRDLWAAGFVVQQRWH